MIILTLVALLLAAGIGSYLLGGTKILGLMLTILGTMGLIHWAVSNTMN